MRGAFAIPIPCIRPRIRILQACVKHDRLRNTWAETITQCYHPHHALLTLVRAIVFSKVDCSVMASVSGHLIDMIQSVPKAAARLVFSERRFGRISPLLRDFHWWVPERICSVCASWRIGAVPSYVADSIHEPPTCNVASTSTACINSPFQRSTLERPCTPSRCLTGVEQSASTAIVLRSRWSSVESWHRRSQGVQWVPFGEKSILGLI